MKVKERAVMRKRLRRTTERGVYYETTIDSRNWPLPQSPLKALDAIADAALDVHERERNRSAEHGEDNRERRNAGV